MKKPNTVAVPTKSKVITINVLFITAMIIIFLGIFFSIFSLVNDIYFKILGSSVSGLVFGLLVLYLGIKYYFSVTKLKEELFKSSSKFSWGNFKRKNKQI
jgi:uncharacterized membrane protein